MKARFRDLTAKYKHIRHQSEALFLSRTLQTFFNKFTKKGKKALARRHIMRARSQLRLTLQRPVASRVLTRSLRRLETPLALLYARQGNTRTIVPVPQRRNKKKSPGLQSLYKARQLRLERDLSERLHLERLLLFGPAHQSPVRRAHSEQNALMYNEGRLNLELR